MLTNFHNFLDTSKWLSYNFEEEEAELVEKRISELNLIVPTILVLMYPVSLDGA